MVENERAEYLQKTILEFWDQVKESDMRDVFTDFMLRQGVSRSSIYQKFRYRLGGVKPFQLEGFMGCINLFKSIYAGAFNQGLDKD